jgi:hypothetical protein
LIRFTFKSFEAFSRQLKNFRSQVLQDSCCVNSCSYSDTLLGGNSLLQKTVNTTNRELQTSSRRSRLGRLLGRRGLSTFSSLSSFSSFSRHFIFDSNRFLLLRVWARLPCKDYPSTRWTLPCFPKVAFESHFGLTNSLSKQI